jgi:hypothetical protein
MYPVQLTPGQLRNAAHLSKETFRHWKRVLPHMRDREGRSTAFSPGDAVALRILRALTDDWGIQINQLAELSSELFRLCNVTPWVLLEGSTLQLSVPGRRCRLLTKNLASDETVLLCPLGPVLRLLREEFLRTELPELQGELPLPPTPLHRRSGET